VVAATAFAPQVRMLELAVVPALVGVPAGDLPAGPAASWAARWRTAAWYLVHLAVGGLVSGVSLAVPPAALLLLVLPFVRGRPRDVADHILHLGHHAAVAPLVGLGMLAALVVLVAGTGAGLARLAPVLLGPSPADRLADLERRAAHL